jgi:hypothetical protein
VDRDSSTEAVAFSLPVWVIRPSDGVCDTVAPIVSVVLSVTLSVPLPSDRVVDSVSPTDRDKFKDDDTDAWTLADSVSFLDTVVESESPRDIVLFASDLEDVKVSPIDRDVFATDTVADAES